MSAAPLRASGEGPAGNRSALSAQAVPSLASRYREVRSRTEWLCEPLQTEDFVVSSMPDVSPTKWHLAHTSWFFETFVLAPHEQSYHSPDARYAFLFNSYYVQAGERHCRAQRGLATRPTVGEVFAYRAHVDEAVLALLDRIAEDTEHPAVPLIELGVQHEQQHQELLVTDIKHVFWMNPLRPAYRPRLKEESGGVSSRALDWVSVADGVYRIGHAPETGGFAFDNEGPPHRVFLEPYRIASRLATNGEYLAFVEDGGYHRPELWLSAGLATVKDRAWVAPLYWERGDNGWTEFTLAGTRPLDPSEPVTHISYYEADAFARWAGHRLPTEFEWEVAAANVPVHGRFVEGERFHPGTLRPLLLVCSSSTVMSGSGHRAHTSPTRITGLRWARSASTMGSGCLTNGCSVVPPVLRPGRMRV
jgi:ergothioneine biosynthesis protein EgtB